ncbi:MAG: glycosyltransferase [Verrucomicrobiota bacterium]
MFDEILLALWSAAGLAWWVVAWWLVNAEERAIASPAGAGPALPALSIFKPLPPLEGRGPAPFARGLESFVAQLAPADELLLGVHESDRASVEPLVAALRKRFPGARVRVIFRAAADAVANPKIAWQMHLAPYAAGELWLWSDADIVAPPGFLHDARREFARDNAAMMTFPYVVKEIPAPSALIEALFVNADFYPGVLLLRGRGAVDFGLGAAMLFERDAFLDRVDWEALGACLADDFQLGQRLAPVRIGRVTLETVAAARSWPEALRRDLRWTKTIRWNRPGGAFARIVILPVLGWVVAVALHPAQLFAWAGLLGMIQADVVAAMAISRAAGCRLEVRDAVGLQLWSVWRAVVWVLAWLPVPVTWSGRAWREPRAAVLKSLDAGYPD